jgi:hypothetical protein
MEGLDTRNLALKLRSAAVISLNLYVNINLPSERCDVGIEAAGRRVSLNSCGQLTDNQHFLPVSDEVRPIPAGRRCLYLLTRCHVLVCSCRSV